MVNDSKTNGPFEYCPEVPRNMWRHAQERLELGMDQLITYNVGASLTMWDELPGQTAAEKKKRARPHFQQSYSNHRIPGRMTIGHWYEPNHKR